jgi:galactose oxidase
MAGLGNAWHIPGEAEPRGRGGMRDPVGALIPGSEIFIFNGNQFAGPGNPGQQLPIGSSILFKRQSEADWQTLPLNFYSRACNNKYYAARIPADTFQAGDSVEYYLRIAYQDHDTTFLRSDEDRSVATADEDEARAQPFTFTVESSAVRGLWSELFTLPNMAIQSHVLKNGLVLIWGRRDQPDQTLNEHECTPFLWNPATGQITFTPQPRLAGGETVNLFCAGHTFLPDGRLLVAGGHLSDSEGVNQATTYDPDNNTWTPTAIMNEGRWYPTNASLPDGSVLVVAGSVVQNVQNLIPQVWKDGRWISISGFPGSANSFPLYPRLHVTSTGLVFMSGSLAQTWSLDISNGGRWTPLAAHEASRDYGTSVMYDIDKIVYIGGGNDAQTHAPTALADVIDLAERQPEWRPTAPMHFPRRQHTGTLLPDGTVLVTGGTRGGGGPDGLGFNDLTKGQPVHISELWDPATERWTELAAEQVDRCYHSTAVLLPDARVLSGGGGDYFPVEATAEINDPADTHRDAQIFSPPYLFKGARPEITAGPGAVRYGETFEVSTPDAEAVGKVSWISLPSVTHGFNQNQRINFLAHEAGAGHVKVTAPASPNVCPPGHSMLFLLSHEGVPSVAKIIQISQPAGAPADAEVLTASPEAAERLQFLDAFGQRDAVRELARGTTVVVGLRGTCPYGIGACWGGAEEALRGLDGVHLVDPIPDAGHSTATVFLEDDRLPALDRWEEQFPAVVDGSYVLRGVEVRLEGRIEARASELFLTGEGRRPDVQLSSIVPADKVQWDPVAGAPERLDPEEEAAYSRLAADQRVTITGPLKQIDDAYRLEVRQVSEARG